MTLCHHLGIQRLNSQQCCCWGWRQHNMTLCHHLGIIQQLSSQQCCCCCWGWQQHNMTLCHHLGIQRLNSQQCCCCCWGCVILSQCTWHQSPSKDHYASPLHSFSIPIFPLPTSPPSLYFPFPFPRLPSCADVPLRNYTLTHFPATKLPPNPARVCVGECCELPPVGFGAEP